MLQMDKDSQLRLLRTEFFKNKKLFELTFLKNWNKWTKAFGSIKRTFIVSGKALIFVFIEKNIFYAHWAYRKFCFWQNRIVLFAETCFCNEGFKCEITQIFLLKFQNTLAAPHTQQIQ